MSLSETPKPVLKSDIFFNLDETQEILVAPIIQRMIDDPNGGMVIGILVKCRNEQKETWVQASFKFIDYETACRIIDYANSRKEETENA